MRYKAVLSYFGFIFFLLLNLQSTGQIKPGDVWMDSNSEMINAHGGGILFYDGVYYWFGEHRDSGRKQFATWKGVRCYSSKDLINWENQGISLSVSEDPESEITAGCNIERPKVIYNKKTGKFVMWFHLELKGQGYSAARTGVAIADSPAGPFTFLRSFRPNAGQWPLNFKDEWKTDTLTIDDLQWWTEQWRLAVKEGLFIRRDFEEGQMARDMTLFVDDDGKAYHIHSAEENLTLHISELTDDYLDFTGRYISVEPAGHNEAPAIFKKDGWYYLITSGCTGWEPNAGRSFRSKSMLGEWEPLGNPFLGEGADVSFRSQSTFILPLNNGEYLFMADRWNPEKLRDSRYIWLPIKIEDAKPIIEWRDQWRLSE